MQARLLHLATDLNTSDRTLRRALKQGLIHADRPSPRSVDIGVDEHSYLFHAWPELSELREALRTEPRVLLAVLFGSKARGDASADSDIDLLVEVREGGDGQAIGSRLAERLGQPVQVVRLDEAEHAPMLLGEILRDGRVLVDRDGLWPGLRKRTASIERRSKAERRRIDDEFGRMLDRVA